MILPMSFILLIFGILRNSNLINIYIEISIFLLFLSNFIILYALYKMNESERLKITLSNRENKEKLNELYYELIEQKYNANRRHIHDSHKHMNIINSLLKNNEYEEAKKYLQSMFEVSLNLSNQICSGNKSLDLVLCNIGDKYDIENIKFVFEKIEDIDTSYDNLYDFITILYNIIENAVESCLFGGTVYISFLRSEINYIVLKVRNTSSKTDENILKSYKENQDNHGIGIMSIRNSVKQLNGKVEFSYDDDLKQFKTLIILPYSVSASK